MNSVPAAWEERAVFRETFMVWLDDPSERELLLGFGELLYRCILEAASAPPIAPPGTAAESVLVRDLRAVAADLEFTQWLLATLGRSPSDNQLRAEELPLASFAAHAAARVGQVIEDLRELLETSRAPR